jgi:hypothetical protein
VPELTEWVEASCNSCGLLYPRRKDYEKKCPVCFKLDRGYELLWGDSAFLWSQQKIVSLQAEVEEQERRAIKAEQRVLSLQQQQKDTFKPGAISIMTLLKLCHPDKHDGSETATEVTKALLNMRKK